MIEKDGCMYMFCKSHKEQEWLGHIMCLVCGRLYQTKEKDQPYFAMHECECGNKLLPDDLGDDEEHGDCFFARAICPKCYQENAPRMKGNITIFGDKSSIPENIKEVYASIVSGMFNNFGLMPCLVNGKKSCAIISYHEEDDGFYITPHFVAIDDKMMFTDLDGNSPGEDPDKKQIN